MALLLVAVAVTGLECNMCTLCLTAVTRVKSAALILREIRPEYVMPVGVWQIREGIRKALKGKANEFNDFQNALSFACLNLSVSKSEWIRNSKIYNNVREQTR